MYSLIGEPVSSLYVTWFVKYSSLLADLKLCVQLVICCRLQAVPAKGLEFIDHLFLENQKTYPL